MSNSILPDVLKDFNYYLKKLPLYLQNSYGFSEHFKIWFDVLMGKSDNVHQSGIVPTADEFLQFLQIYDSNYINHINADPTSENGTKSDILDKLGLLFGIKRNFAISYELEGQTINKQLSLNNYEFLILLKLQIANSYCEGTWKQITDAYANSGLQMLQITSGAGFSEVYLLTADNTDIDYSENIRDMFYAGLLRIESMGIDYTQAILTIDILLFWYINEAELDEHGLDVSYWENKIVSVWSDENDEGSEWGL